MTAYLLAALALAIGFSSLLFLRKRPRDVSKRSVELCRDKRGYFIRMVIGEDEHIVYCNEDPEKSLRASAALLGPLKQVSKYKYST